MDCVLCQGETRDGDERQGSDVERGEPRARGLRAL